MRFEEGDILLKTRCLELAKRSKFCQNYFSLRFRKQKRRLAKKSLKLDGLVVQTYVQSNGELHLKVLGWTHWCLTFVYDLNNAS